MNFNGATRIQNTAKHFNVISMKLYRSSSENFTALLNKSNRYILILVQSEYAKVTFQIRGWHDKHFVLLIEEEGRYFLLNDIPFVKQEVKLKDVSGFYAGEYFVIELHKNEFLATSLFLEKKVPLITISGLKYNKISPDKMMEFRDLVGIYRVLLRRQKAFCQSKMSNEFFDDFIREADAVYMRTEYLILKHSISNHELDNLWESLLKSETIIQKRLIEEGICIAAN